MEKSKLTDPIPFVEVNTTDAQTAYKQVLDNAGVSLYRDAVDSRIIEEVKTGKEKFGNSFEGGKNGIIDSQNDVGGWPSLQSTKPATDSDNDGMPDDWEKTKKLNPNEADNNKYTLNKNYTNLEVYLNSLVEKQMVQ